MLEVSFRESSYSSCAKKTDGFPSSLRLKIKDFPKLTSFRSEFLL